MFYGGNPCEGDNPHGGEIPARGAGLPRFARNDGNGHAAGTIRAVGTGLPRGIKPLAMTIKRGAAGQRQGGRLVIAPTETTGGRRIWQAAVC